ncbi:MAG: cysteine desulfurase [Oscillospiraceae bacterium]|nr:cysteine desulfurase [Candidatus Ruminococcus equi]
MNIHYLDNSATTQVSKKSAEKALEIMTTKYANPASLYNFGLDVEKEVSHAREVIANSLSVSDDEIFFTSGSTESNNTVLFSTAKKRRKDGNKIIVSSIEHSSVIESAKELEESGFDVVYLPVNPDGTVSLDALSNAVDDKTILVSIMAVNNEIGSVNPIDKIAKIVKSKSDAYFHCDAVQAYGKITLKPQKWGVDFMSVSGHKVHAPKGVGALYIKKGTKFSPLIFGGEQQKKIRPGTENSPCICAFGTAVEEFDIKNNFEYVSELNSYLREKLQNIDGVTINSPDNALPYLLNISAVGIKSETMLHFLSQYGVYVSSGSACSKGKKSYVLSALGLNNDLIDSALRISFSKYNTKDDIDILVQYLNEGIKTLSRK